MTLESIDILQTDSHSVQLIQVNREVGVHVCVSSAGGKGMERVSETHFPSEDTPGIKGSASTFLIMSHVIIPLPVFSIKQVCVTILLNR